MWNNPALSIPQIAEVFRVSTGSIQYWVMQNFGYTCRETPAKSGRPSYSKYGSAVVVVRDVCPFTFKAQPARPRPTDRPGERWLQLV